jgi:chromosome partitioning protein
VGVKMPIYALWNNKGGVGKSYLTFQIACEYARTHPDQRILVIDMCPQANSSMMLLGGMTRGETNLDAIVAGNPRLTIAGYMEARIQSPYTSPHVGGTYALQVRNYNNMVPSNLYLVPGDEELELQASRVVRASLPGPPDAWRIVHAWISDLISDIRDTWNITDSTVFY